MQLLTWAARLPRRRHLPQLPEQVQAGGAAASQLRQQRLWQRHGRGACRVAHDLLHQCQLHGPDLRLQRRLGAGLLPGGGREGRQGLSMHGMQ